MIRVVGGAALRGDQVLVARRPPGGPHGGRWEFPGGKVEAGEGDRAALVRELREELAVDATVGALLAEGGDGRIALRVYLVDFQGEPHPTEGQSVRWVDAEQLADLDLPPADRPAALALRPRMRGV